MEFTFGDGSLIRGLELSLLGLMTGQKQTIRIPAKEGYGFSDVKNHHFVDIERFPADMLLQEGMLIDMGIGEEATPATVVRIEDRRVLLDFNHPLAGHEIIFDVEIVDVGPSMDIE